MIRAVALDLDGVVYAGDQVLPGAPEAVQILRTWGMLVWFITNASSQSRAQLAVKLSGMGIKANPDDVFSSGYAAANIALSQRPGRTPSVLVLGTDDLKQEMMALGVRPVSGPECDVLVVGFDANFSYGTIERAVEALTRGAIFIACNRDATFPGRNGTLHPGCGSLVAAIEYAAGRKADRDAGKPETALLEMACARDGIRPTEVVVVGDSLQSDIAMARRFGSMAVLVRNRPGLVSRIDLPAPDFLVEQLADVPGILEAIQPMGKL